MNRYGLMAMEHWQEHAPDRVESLENPQAFFETLGESVLAQVEQTATALERALPPDLSYLERVAHLRAIQAQAEEIALAELVFSVEPETPDLVEELEELLGSLPSTQMIHDELTRLTVRAQEEADRENRPTFLTSEEEHRKARLEALLPLVAGTDPEDMPEPALRERILQLRALA